MTNPLLILADRVEGLSGPCRETDALIHKLFGVPSVTRDWPHAAERYTGSLDSAASLVTEVNGQRPQVEYIGPNPNNPRQGHRVTLWCEGATKTRGHSLSSAPLALTAACLRARAIAANQEASA